MILTDPFDCHVHLRQGQMLLNVTKYTARQFAGAIVMPNLNPPVISKDAVASYREQIFFCCECSEVKDFQPYMTAYFQPNWDYQYHNIIAVKLYPKYLTTNAEFGVDLNDEKGIYSVLEQLEALEIPLSVHGEAPGYFHDRESLFVTKYLPKWAERFPKLKIILEHISTFDSAKAVVEYKNVYATITPHHMLLTGDDWVGPPLNVHNYCMPVCKRDVDRQLLIELASKSLKVALGTDSAPHLNKEHSGCAGIFTAPIALQLVAEVFDGDKTIMENFCCLNAHNIYNDFLLNYNKQVLIEKKPFVIPTNYNGIIPMWAGRTINYSIERIL